MGIIVFVLHWWISTKEYMFTEEEIASIARKYVGECSGCLFKAVDGSQSGTVAATLNLLDEVS